MSDINVLRKLLKKKKWGFTFNTFQPIDIGFCEVNLRPHTFIGFCEVNLRPPTLRVLAKLFLAY